MRSARNDQRAGVAVLAVLLAAARPALGAGPPAVAPIASAVAGVATVPRLPGDFTSTAPGQPEAQAHSPPPASVSGRAVTIEHRSLLEDPARLLALAPWPAPYRSLVLPATPRLVVRKYHGPERCILDRLDGLYRAACMQAINARVDRTSESLPQIEGRLMHFYEAKGDRDAGGRWWERSIFDSFTPEAGGAPRGAFILDVGEETEFLTLGDASLTNEGKLHWGKLELFFGPTPPVSLDSSAAWVTGRPLSSSLVSRADDRDPEDATLELEQVLSGTSCAWRAGVGRVRAPAHGNILTTDEWVIDCRPSLNFSLPRGSIASVIQCAELDFDVRYQPREATASWRVIFGSVTCSPADRSVQFVVGTEIVGW
jgi:hypothetical protein